MDNIKMIEWYIDKFRNAYKLSISLCEPEFRLNFTNKELKDLAMILTEYKQIKEIMKENNL